MILSSCGKNEIEPYESKNIEITDLERTKKEKDEEIQIDGLYPVKKDTYMYSDKDENTKYDFLEEDSLVKIIMEAEDGYVYVDYNGNDGYIKVENLKL